ncbi:MAG: tetratricopeptide repeat protein, partial [Candidatus Omnitrophota bacterium]
MDENTAKAVRLNDAATAKLSAGNLDGAEIDLLQALEYSGNNASVRKNLGVVYFEKGTRALKVKKDYFEAQRYFRDALRIEPTSAVYKRGLASALFLEAGQRSRQGQSELALTLYEKAAAADPQNSAVWAAASQQAWQMQKLDKAADYLQKAKTLKPSDKNVQVLEQRLRTPAAEKNYETRQSEHFVLSADEGF